VNLTIASDNQEKKIVGNNNNYLHSSNNNLNKKTLIDEFIDMYDKIKSRKLNSEESNLISNYSVKLLNHLEIPIRDPSLVAHKYNNLKQEFLNLREKYESSKNRLRI